MPYKLKAYSNRIIKDSDVLDNATLNAVGSPILSLSGRPTDEDVNNVSAEKIEENSLVGRKLKDGSIPIGSLSVEGFNKGDSLIFQNGKWVILRINSGNENDALTSTGWKKWISDVDIGATTKVVDPESTTNNNILYAESTLVRTQFRDEVTRTPGMGGVFVNIFGRDPSVHNHVPDLNDGINVDEVPDNPALRWGIVRQTADRGVDVDNQGSTLLFPSNEIWDISIDHRWHRTEIHPTIHVNGSPVKTMEMPYLIRYNAWPKHQSGSNFKNADFNDPNHEFLSVLEGNAPDRELKLSQRFLLLPNLNAPELLNRVEVKINWTLPKIPYRLGHAPFDSSGNPSHYTNHEKVRCLEIFPSHCGYISQMNAVKLAEKNIPT